MTETQWQANSNNDQLHDQKKKKNRMLALSLVNVIKQAQQIHFQCWRKGQSVIKALRKLGLPIQKNVEPESLDKIMQGQSKRD